MTHPPSATDRITTNVAYGNIDVHKGCSPKVAAEINKPGNIIVDRFFNVSDILAPSKIDMILFVFTCMLFLTFFNFVQTRYFDFTLIILIFSWILLLFESSSTPLFAIGAFTVVLLVTSYYPIQSQ